jgi:hypothetical protein
MKDNSFDSEEFSLDDSEVNEETEDMNEEKNINNLDLIKVISDILTTIIEENEKLPNIKQIVLNQKKMCFNEIAIPNVLIYDYLKRIQEYTFIERNTLILSLIYIDRLCNLGQITLTHYNVHRILFGAILISIKYNEDTFYGNNYYAEIAGVKLNELNSIEYNFILLCNYQMFVSDETFKQYNDYLISSSEIKKGISSDKKEF